MITVRFYRHIEQGRFGAMLGHNGETVCLFNYKDDQELRAGLVPVIRYINQHPDEEVHLFDAELTDFPNKECFQMVLALYRRFLPLEESVRQLKPSSWYDFDEKPEPINNNVVEAYW